MGLNVNPPVPSLRPVAATLGSEAELDRAAALIDVNGAIRQRLIARDGGARAVARALAERFLEPPPG